MHAFSRRNRFSDKTLISTAGGLALNGPMETRLIQVNSVDIAYQIVGSGPTIVLIGGMGMDINVWKGTYLAGFLKANFQVLMLNLRGMPPSDVPIGPYTVAELASDCDQVLQNLGIHECFVVGMSLGALVAQELILLNPNGKVAQVLVAPVGKITQWVEMSVKAEIALYDSGVDYPSDYMVYTELLQIFTPEELTNDKRVIRMARHIKSQNCGAIGRRGLLSAVANYGNRLDALSTIENPTLIIAFRDDVLTPCLLSVELANRLANCKSIIYESCGHYGIFDKRQCVQNDIIQFLSQHY